MASSWVMSVLSRGQCHCGISCQLLCCLPTKRWVYECVRLFLTVWCQELRAWGWGQQLWCFTGTSWLSFWLLFGATHTSDLSLFALVEKWTVGWLANESKVTVWQEMEPDLDLLKKKKKKRKRKLAEAVHKCFNGCSGLFFYIKAAVHNFEIPDKT